MATKEEKEIVKHVKIALDEIGEITPHFSKKFNAWIFSHSLYPVEYAGETKEEVIENYPLYLKEFIRHRLQDKLSPLMENKTKGHGGKRIGAGRPEGTKKEEKVRIYVPKDIASWLQYPETITHIRSLFHAFGQ
ncbi:MAG: hypothetical protein LLF94_01725 [Chlamydiales bacterium]|nr:hypothetical protein [Chlamydiales bacterium]